MSGASWFLVGAVVASLAWIALDCWLLAQILGPRVPGPRHETARRAACVNDQEAE